MLARLAPPGKRAKLVDLAKLSNRAKIMYALIKLTSPGKVIKLNQQAWIIKPIWVPIASVRFLIRAVRILFGIA